MKQPSLSGHIKVRKVKPTSQRRVKRTSYEERVKAKMQKRITITRPEVDGIAKRQELTQPIITRSNTGVGSTPEVKETYSVSLNLSKEDKRLAAQHKPSAKPVPNKPVTNGVMPREEFTKEERRAMRKHNRQNPKHQIHF